MSIHCSRGDDKRNKRSEHWSISPLSSPVFATYVWCSCVVPSPFPHPCSWCWLILFSVLSVILVCSAGCLAFLQFIVPIFSFVLYHEIVPWGTLHTFLYAPYVQLYMSLTHFGSDYSHVFQGICFVFSYAVTESAYGLLVIQSSLDAYFHLDLRLPNTSYILTNRFITYRCHNPGFLLHRIFEQEWRSVTYLLHIKKTAWHWDTRTIINHQR